MVNTVVNKLFAYTYIVKYIVKYEAVREKLISKIDYVLNCSDLLWNFGLGSWLTIAPAEGT